MATVILATVVAGCGGGSDEALSKTELIAKADAICKNVNDRTNALRAPTNIKSAARLLRRTLAILGGGLARLDKLKPPGDLEPAYDKWIAKNVELVAAARQAQTAAARGDERQLQSAVAQASEVHNEANRLAAKIGLEVCATQD